MSQYCIIGSGISGSTIANLLSKKNSVEVFDKARGPGGRSSFKRLDNDQGFDHGMQYISPKNLKFKKFINTLIKKKILKKWAGKHIYLKKGEKKNHEKIIGAKGNNDVCKFLLKKINISFQSEVKKIEYKNKFWNLKLANGELKIVKRLILTCPFPQLIKLSKKFIHHSFINKRLKMDANITVMIALKKNKMKPSSYLFNDKILGWAANENSKKRFSSKFDLWTLQSTSSWANKKINKNKDNKDINSKILIDKFFKLTGFKYEKPAFILNHGWKYSSHAKKLNISSYWDPKINLGICADWFVGPRFEAGWISANDLFKKINN